MIRRPPRSTRTDTLFPYTTLFRSEPEDYAEILDDAGLKVQARAPMTPIVKLIFGAGHDKARLTEYAAALRSEEHTSELQSLMRISYAVFCLKKKKNKQKTTDKKHTEQIPETTLQ